MKCGYLERDISGRLLILRNSVLEQRAGYIYTGIEAEHETGNFPRSPDDACGDTRLLKYDIRVPTSIQSA